jgi:hypothetical protein
LVSERVFAIIRMGPGRYRGYRFKSTTLGRM